MRQTQRGHLRQALICSCNPREEAHARKVLGKILIGNNEHRMERVERWKVKGEKIAISIEKTYSLKAYFRVLENQARPVLCHGADSSYSR